MKRTILTAICLLVAAVTTPIFAQQTKQHEVKAGETLYSISRSYGLTVDQVRAANPNLGEVILTGQKLNIPTTQAAQPTTAQPQQIIILPVNETTKRTEEQVPTPTSLQVSDGGTNVKMMYEVKKKETLYGISKQFGLTVDQLLAANPEIDPDKKLKKGAYLRIPFTEEELIAMQPVVEEEPVVEEKILYPVNLAVIMPFGLNEEKKTKDIITMVDFYEGVMLAMSDLKKEGVSANIHVYDEADIDSVLRLPWMKELNLIIGAKDAANITKLTNFAEKNDINLVVPMSSSATLVNNTRNVFQVNQKMESDAYNRSFELFTSLHPRANFIFVNIAEQTDKMDYIVRMKNFLNKKSINYNSVEFKEMETITDVLAEGKENIIVPSSSTKTAFDRLTKKLNSLELGAYDIDLFGYTDWQAFAEKSPEEFKKYNCTFFTTFYYNPNSTESISFNQKFRNIFMRDQFNTHPRYGMLGYDITKFFVKNMYEQGEDFKANISNLESNSLQNPLHFEHKNTWSGYINNALMLVKYNSDGTISVKQM